MAVPDDSVFKSVTFAGIQKPNWGSHSGANGIMDVVPSSRIYLRGPSSIFLYYAFRPFRRAIFKRNTWYDANSAFLEFRVATDWLRRQNHIYHFLSGENEYLFAGHLKKLRKCYIACTFHSPITEYVRTVLDKKAVSKIDAIIVVASNQIEYFSTVAGRDRVWHVPHGVHTDYWSSGKAPAHDECRVLFVGSHWRDLDTLRRVIQIAGTNPRIRFDAVVSPIDASALTGLERLTIHSWLEDDDLLLLYRSSTMMVCPLLQFTASNSILEALACGLPIIATKTGAICDYVTPECAILTPAGDAQAMAEAVLALCADEARQRKMSKAGRRRAIQLDWRVIAQSLAELYRQLLSRAVAL